MFPHGIPPPGVASPKEGCVRDELDLDASDVPPGSKSPIWICPRPPTPPSDIAGLECGIRGRDPG